MNTVTAYGADGYGEPLPLQYALDKNALLVYRVNGEELKASEGSSVQLWMPETVARYFTRNIASIELTREDAVPEVASVDPWTSCDTDGATADKWVNWRFTTSFDEAGDYEMTVRARTADDVVSPLSASLSFAVR